MHERNRSFILTTGPLMAADRAPRTDLLPPWLASDTAALVYGPLGIGKSLLALAIAWVVAAGGSFLDWRASRPLRVAYLDGEMAATEMRDRLALFGPVPETLMFRLADLGTERAIPDLADRPARAIPAPPARPVGDRQPREPGRLPHQGPRPMAHGPALPDDPAPTADRGADQPSEGARFELHFEKTRSLVGTAIDPIEARLTVDADGRAQWSWSKTATHELGRVAALLRDGLNPNQVARELGISKSKAYRLRQQMANLPPA